VTNFTILVGYFYLGHSMSNERILINHQYKVLFDLGNHSLMKLVNRYITYNPDIYTSNREFSPFEEEGLVNLPSKEIWDLDLKKEYYHNVTSVVQATADRIYEFCELGETHFTDLYSTNHYQYLKERKYLFIATVWNFDDKKNLLI
jgi:hypothetical protein